MRIFRRSSVTGEFVTEDAAANDPDRTVTERLPGPDEVRNYARALCQSLRENGDLNIISRQSIAAYDYLRLKLNQKGTN